MSCIGRQVGWPRAALSCTSPMVWSSMVCCPTYPAPRRRRCVTAASWSGGGGRCWRGTPAAPASGAPTCTTGGGGGVGRDPNTAVHASSLVCCVQCVLHSADAGQGKCGDTLATPSVALSRLCLAHCRPAHTLPTPPTCRRTQFTGFSATGVAATYDDAFAALHREHERRARQGGLAVGGGAVVAQRGGHTCVGRFRCLGAVVPRVVRTLGWPSACWATKPACCWAGR